MIAMTPRTSVPRASLAVLLIVLVTCLIPRGNRPEPVRRAEQTPVDLAIDGQASPGSPTAQAPTATLRFDPDALSACEAEGTVVAIAWDATSVPRVQFVRIFIVAEDGSETLFAEVAPKGQKDSGRWMHAGTTLVVRNVTDGSELVRRKMGALPCGKPAVKPPDHGSDAVRQKETS
jgi:hypothetical protein